MEAPIKNIKEIIQLLFENRIDINDLSKTQRKEILYQSKQMIDDAIRFTDQIMRLPSNSHQDFDRLLNGNSKYVEGQYLKRLIENFVEILPENQNIINYHITNVTQSNVTQPKPKNNQKENKKMTSYVWQGNPDIELPELYSHMKDTYKLIDPQTNLEQFKAVFKGQDIEKIKPIKWLHTNRLLAYFLDCAFSGQDWQSIAGNGKLFINSNLKIITANDLSVAKKGYVDFGKPKGYEIIDMILKTIKKH